MKKNPWKRIDFTKELGKPCDVIKIEEYQNPTTGCKECDRDINDAVDHALLRLKPVIRDILREELKRTLKLEEVDKGTGNY